MNRVGTTARLPRSISLSEIFLRRWRPCWLLIEQAAHKVFLSLQVIGKAVPIPVRYRDKIIPLLAQQVAFDNRLSYTPHHRTRSVSPRCPFMSGVRNMSVNACMPGYVRACIRPCVLVQPLSCAACRLAEEGECPLRRRSKNTRESKGSLRRHSRHAATNTCGVCGTARRRHHTCS